MQEKRRETELGDEHISFSILHTVTTQRFGWHSGIKQNCSETSNCLYVGWGGHGDGAEAVDPRCITSPAEAVIGSHQRLRPSLLPCNMRAAWRPFSDFRWACFSLSSAATQRLAGASVFKRVESYLVKQETQKKRVLPASSRDYDVHINSHKYLGQDEHHNDFCFVGLCQ